jgi:protein SCO1/2
MSVGTSKLGPKDAGVIPRSNRRYMVLALIGLCAAVGASLLLPNQRKHTFFGQSIRPPQSAFDFRLTNQQGKEVRLSHWRGHVVLFSFGFTHCPNVCPTTLTNLVTVYQALPSADRQRVRIALISVDTQRDRPAALRDYLSYFDPTFIGLTGSKEDIDRVIGAFGASYALIHKPDDAPENYNVMHSANIYLVNPEGDWELIYDFQQLQEPAKVASDINYILRR